MRTAFAQRIVFGLALACVLPLWSAPTLALDPALDLSQYAHTAWKLRDGFANSPINALAQTRDGYLWLGTDTGLMRFDGVRIRPWQPPPGMSLPHNRVGTLLVSHDGTLWIGTLGGLASWDGSKLRTYPQLSGSTVYPLIQDREGTIWASGGSPTAGLLCAIRSAAIDCNGSDGKFGAFVTALYEDSRDTLWAVSSNGLWRSEPGPPKWYLPPDPVTGGIQSLSETATGALLLVTRNGIRQLSGDKFEPFPVPSLPAQGRPQVLFRDRDGALWIGMSDGGLLHIHQGRTDVFQQADGLSGNQIYRIFEDREGSVWVTTQGGLDRFRAFQATAYGTAQGMLGAALSLLPDRDGAVWLSTNTGLYRRNGGRVSVFRARNNRSPTRPAQPAVDEVVIEGLPDSGAASLFEDSHGRIWLGFESQLGYLDNARFVSLRGVPKGVIDSIVEDRQGNLWVAHRDAGLLRISPDLEVHSTGTPNNGRASRLATDPIGGGVWLGSFAGGIVHWVDGAARESYVAAGGLGKGRVSDVRVAADGTVWAATEEGLSRIKAGRIATLNASNGLPCDAVTASLEDDDGATWVYAACGLVRIARADLEAWGAAVDQGKPKPAVPVYVLDSVDGVRTTFSIGGTYTPHFAKARDGKLWFAMLDAVASVDPRDLPINTLPPPVHVEQLVADRKAYAPSGPLSLPPLVRDLAIDYTALSLVAPEKIQFRYRLEGRDRDWQDAGNRRQAFYTDLAPGNYRFRVIASNNSGVWNEEGASLAFTIAPAYWQTNWFLALCAVAFAALLWGIYQARMRVLARHRDMQMELAHANRLATMGQLTASIAHEVNQPLGATITNVQAALRWLKAKSPDPAEIREALDHAVLAGNRAADVIARIRKLAKKAPAQHEAVYLNGEIDGILIITHGEAMKHDVSVRTDLARNLPAITADRVELQQVLLNLIVNAIEAMANVTEGARELTIRSEEDGGGGVVVSVIDTGPGLDREALERIFQAFYTSKENGLGMGLSICRSIIESYGGKLWASANTPRGAIFRFTLPAAVQT